MMTEFKRDTYRSVTNFEKDFVVFLLRLDVDAIWSIFTDMSVTVLLRMPLTS